MSDTPRILIADDEPLARELLRHRLEEFSHAVDQEADSGEATLAAMEANSLDLVFLDIEMPDGNGIDLVPKIKAANPDAFIVMVSSHSSFETMKQAVDQGADCFIVKPFSRDRLGQVLAQYETRLAGG